MWTGLALGASSNSLPSSNLCTCWECREFPKNPPKTWKVKKKSHVTILKMNSLHSLHLMCPVMNSRFVNFTRQRQFTLDIANPACGQMIHLYILLTIWQTLTRYSKSSTCVVELWYWIVWKGEMFHKCRHDWLYDLVLSFCCKTKSDEVKWQKLDGQISVVP